MRNQHITRIWIGLCICLTAFLAVHPVPVKYTVSFRQGDAAAETQSVWTGQMPTPPDPVPPEGTRFLCWDPAPVPAAGDAVYHAVFVAELKAHVPYLFADAAGALCPDAVFTGAELRLALEALAGAARNDLPDGLPEADTLITAGILREVLEPLFPEGMDGAFSGFAEDWKLTRSDAACILNRLLDRSNETVSPGRGVLGFPDVTPERQDYAALLEAAIPHDPGSTQWDEILLPTGHSAGWELREGQLYCYDAFGYLLRDTVVEGVFTLDALGRYTSGDPVLDGLVTERLAAYQAEDPAADRETLLRYAYNDTRDSYQYLRRDNYLFGENGWEVQDAITMMQTGMGNCYNYAAVFWALARGLGYDAQAISGFIGSRSDMVTPHGWVRIDLEDGAYYFDPEMEMSRDKNLGIDLFKQEREHAIGIWHYVEPD